MSWQAKDSENKYNNPRNELVLQDDKKAVR